jgi:DNA-binding beta-propeller fold protein YncE
MQLQLKSRKILVAVLIILLIALTTLLYVYFALSSTRTNQEAEANGFDYLFSIYGYGNRASQLMSRPNGIAISKSSNIYITDQGNNRVLVFDKNGDFLLKFGKKGNGKGEFESPMGIAISPDNQVFVTDRIQDKVLIFDAAGKFVKEFKIKTPLTPEVRNDRLYLTTYNGIAIYDLGGKLIRKYGKRGKDRREFDFPNGIDVDENGNMYIADSNNIRVQALNKEGNTLWITGEPPRDLKNSKRLFGLPVSIAIDEDNLIYVVDAFPGSIRVLDSKGKPIAELGDYGTKDGQLNHPAQIAYAGNRIFYIVDKYNDRVQAIKIPKPSD